MVKNRLQSPRIGVYAGRGTSHSWLWFVDIFERMGFCAIDVLDESAIDAGGLDGLTVLAVSGGDTFAMARALGPSGARRVRDFVEGGGLYVGSCAGAYLVMNSSKPHLNLFNFTPVKITNLSKRLPDCQTMTHKFSMAYGCDYIFHPVRESVAVRVEDHWPHEGRRTLEAPLYGGPGMQVAEAGHVLARYADFTDKTVFLVDEPLARDTLVGTAAAVRVPLGKGRLYLFGPHFEHPRYPAANRVVADAVHRDGNRVSGNDAPVVVRLRETLPPSAGNELLRTLKRELSNARIVAAGLEMMPVRWRIGAKVYEPEKIRVFLESMWRRLRPLEKHGRLSAGTDLPGALTAHARETTDLLRRMKRQLDNNEETLETARQVFERLHHYSIGFFDLYFQTFRASRSTADPKGRIPTVYRIAGVDRTAQPAIPN